MSDSMPPGNPPGTPSQRQQQMTIAVAVVIFVVFVAFMFILLLNANQPQQTAVNPEQLAAEAGINLDNGADTSADDTGNGDTANNDAEAGSSDPAAAADDVESEASAEGENSADAAPTPDLPASQEEAVAVYAAAGIDINAIISRYAEYTRSESERGTPLLGDPDAPITLSEFSSFTCGHCLNFHEGQFMELLAGEIASGAIKFEFISVARNDFDAVATAAITCAATQDRLWEMHDLIFAWVGAGGSAELSPLYPQIGPQALGMDQEAYLACINSDAPFEQAQANTDLFRQYITDNEGVVTGTPTLLFNGEPTLGSGGYPVERIREVLATLQ